MSTALFWSLYVVVGLMVGFGYVWLAHYLDIGGEPVAMLAAVWPVVLPLALVVGGCIWLGSYVSASGDRARERAMEKKRQRRIAKLEVERILRE